MRKVMMLAAMLAMVLWAAAPALAQNAAADDEGTATGGDVDNSTSVQYVDCSQIQSAANAQYGDATASDSDAVADDGSNAAVDNSAELSANLGISQAQINACLGTVNTGGGTPTATPTATTTVTTSVLPDSGGASLFALGAGALLVAGGLLARRIVR